MFRSATFKLTLWYLALAMAISLLFSIVLYQVTTGELSRGLHRETDRISLQFPVFQNSPLLAPKADYESGAHRILFRLIGFNGLVLVGAGFASYWLARRTLRPIEEAHEQQKRFTADVSHELRTPLTAIRMESEVALADKSISRASLRQVLASNVEETGNLESLINNLLRLTRLEADELQQNYELISTAWIASDAVNQMAKPAGSKSLTVNNNVKEWQVKGDPASLSQLLIILLDNAIKFSPPKAAIDLNASSRENMVYITVTDQGPGIAPEALKHVFDRFYRADDSRTKNQSEGFGLGLSIAKMIADRHNGSVTLTSRVGQGTRATLALPIARQ